MFFLFFIFEAEDGIRVLVRSRGLGDVYKRQPLLGAQRRAPAVGQLRDQPGAHAGVVLVLAQPLPCLLYTSDAADERSSVDLGGRRIIKKKHNTTIS